MARTPKPEFAASSTLPKGVLILFCEEGVKFGQAARKVLDPTGDLSFKTQRQSEGEDA